MENISWTDFSHESDRVKNEMLHRVKEERKNLYTIK